MTEGQFVGPQCCGRGGRRLPPRQAAGLFDHVDPVHLPHIPHVIEGARAYARNNGMPDPHAVDYRGVRATPELLRDAGESYNRLPDHDPAALPHFHAFRDEVLRQHHFLTNVMGIHHQVTDEDPYRTPQDMHHDLVRNHRIKVMAAATTGGHPFLSHDENEKFRAVHDVFGHLGSGGGFDRHSEEAAFGAHARMFSDKARPALATETRGQFGANVVNGGFGAQKIALLPRRLWTPGGLRTEAALPKAQKCDYCSKQATKRLLWAEGIAYIPVCDEHEDRGRHRIEVTNHDEVVGIRPVGKESARRGRQTDPATLTPKDFDGIRRMVHDVREEACAGGQCGVTSEILSNRHGWAMHGGIYHAPDGRPIGDHVWNVHEPSGTIIDSTADQWGEGHDVRVLSPDHPDHSRYRFAEDEDDENRKLDEARRLRKTHGDFWWTRTAGLDLEEYRLADDAQRRRYETAGNAGSQGDYEAYYGQGEQGGRGKEKRVTLKDFMQHSRTPGLEDMPPEFQENWRGHEMGYRHARSGRIDHEELSAILEGSPHPDHFMGGYEDGLAAGFGEPVDHKIAVMLDPEHPGQPKMEGGAVVFAPWQPLRRTAHVSDNQVDVFHCFAGEERFLTPEGPKSFVETAGTVQKVLTSSRGNHEGQWVDAPIRYYGDQEIWELTLTRNKQRKVIRTTAGHRWMVGRPGAYRIVTTENLREGHRLAHLRTLIQNVEPSRLGIRHGIFYGDGTVQRRDYGAVNYGAITLWGEKAKDLAEYFEDICPSEPTETSRDSGIIGLRFTSGMIGWVKALPDLSIYDAAYLRGWLMGYIATDGDVDRSGKVSLSSSVIENLEHVRNVATILGVGTYGITTKLRKGYGAAPSPLHAVAFASGDLDTSWLLRQAHRDAFSAVKHRSDRFGWTVVAAESTGEIAPVYCAEVPQTESFALEDNIWTKNCPFCGSGGIVARADGSIECTFCNSAFTVTVSPVYPSFPQSVNGQPYPWPGRPDGGVDPSMMGDPNADPGAAADGSGFGGKLVPGNGGAEDVGDGDDDSDGDSDGDSPPWAKDDDDDSDDDDSEAEVGGKKKPPFGKKSALTRRKHIFVDEGDTALCGAQDLDQLGPRKPSDIFDQGYDREDNCPECHRRLRESVPDGVPLQARPIYHTTAGVKLPLDEYIRHLAIATAKDPNAMAAQIRFERRG